MFCIVVFCYAKVPLLRGVAAGRGVDSAPLGPAKLKISWVSLGEGDHEVVAGVKQNAERVLSLWQKNVGEPFAYI